jgi:hypothetical protein
MENMSEAISLCGVVYLVSAALLFLAIVSARREKAKAND